MDMATEYILEFALFALTSGVVWLITLVGKPVALWVQKQADRLESSVGKDVYEVMVNVVETAVQGVEQLSKTNEIRDAARIKRDKALADTKAILMKLGLDKYFDEDDIITAIESAILRGVHEVSYITLDIFDDDGDSEIGNVLG